jgi:hypothetical protein
VAKALKLDLSSKATRAKVVGLIKVWLASGALVEVEGQDDRRRIRAFVEVAEEG